MDFGLMCDGWLSIPEVGEAAALTLEDDSLVLE